MSKVRQFSLLSYIETALKQAEYTRDEDGIIIAHVTGASGFFAEGETFEDARTNLRDVIEGNVMLALQLGWPIPTIQGIVIEEQDAEALPA